MERTIKQIQKKILSAYQGWTVSLSGDWGTPKIQNRTLEIWLDQFTAAISFTNKYPKGYSPTFPNDPYNCYRLLVAKDGTVVASIYGLIYHPKSLPDLYRETKKSKAIDIAHKLYFVRCPVPDNYKWFRTETFSDEELSLTDGQKSKKFSESLIRLKRSLIEGRNHEN